MLDITRFLPRTIAAIMLYGVFSLGAQAAVLHVNPPINCLGPSCFTTNENGGHDTAAFSQLSGLTLLYKAESGDPLSATPDKEEGTLKYSYSTEFLFSNEDEYTGAKITYDGGPAVDCSVHCYLVVKDGEHEPARYLFDLALSPYEWDGVMVLNITGFWQNGVRGSDGKGSISHVAIYGDISEIPVPAAFWLFGTALIGFIGISRRTRV